MSNTPRTAAVCEKLIAWATKNPNATIGDAAKFIVKTFTEDMAEVERELNEARAKLAALQAKPDVAGLVAHLDSLVKHTKEVANSSQVSDASAERYLINASYLQDTIDALLSLSAQLQEKEAECNAKTEVLLEAQRIAAQAQAECEGLRQDAERYRWVRSPENAWPSVELPGGNGFQGLSDEKADAAIDSAREGKP